jgi:DHA3 family macrolide efflux protein-like MFS transporter
MTAPATRFRAFVIVWVGQFLSLAGSALMDFALGVYVYTLTGSATTLAVILVLAMLPMIIASPVAGSLVDRWGPKPALLLTTSGNVVLAAILALLLLTGTFQVWHVYLIVIVGSTLGALEMPALSSLTPQLVPKELLGQANGMRMAAMAASQVLGPVAAGFLLLGIGIQGIVLIDLITFVIALGTLLVVDVPRPRPQPSLDDEEPDGLLAEFRQGWRYVTARRGLFALLLFLAAVNFSAGVVELLLTPLLLSFTSPDGLGTVMSVGGAGMILAGIAVSATGGPRRRVRGILVTTGVLSLAIIAGALRPSVALIAAAAFVFMAGLAVVISTNQSIWQSKVDPHMLGRVGSIVAMVGSIPQLAAYALAGPAVDGVFEPLVGHEEVRWASLAALLGTGPGRGIALLMLLMGVLMAITVAVAALNPRLRRLEDELADAEPHHDEKAGRAEEPAPEPDEAAVPNPTAGAR